MGTVHLRYAQRTASLVVIAMQFLHPSQRDSPSPTRATAGRGRRGGYNTVAQNNAVMTLSYLF